MSASLGDDYITNMTRFSFKNSITSNRFDVSSKGSPARIRVRERRWVGLERCAGAALSMTH